MELKDAVTRLTWELRNVPDYRIGWQANIAMSFVDAAHNYKKRNSKTYLTAVDIHIIANEATENFLTALCKV